MQALESIGLIAALRQLYAFMEPGRRLQFFAALALMLLGAIAETAAIASLLGFLSLLAGEESSNRLAALLPGSGSGAGLVHAAAYLFIAIALLAGAVRLLLVWTTQRFVHQLGHDVAVEIVRRILLQPYRFHTRHHSSEVLSSLDKSQVLVHVLLQLMQAAAAALIAIFIVATLVWIDPFTALATATIFAGLYLIVSRVASERLARNSRESSRAYAERLKMLHESLGGIRDLIIDETHELFIDSFRAVDRRFTRAVASNDIIAVAPRLLIETAGMVAVAALALVLADREGGLPSAIPILGAIALGALRLMPFAQQLYASWATLSGNRGTFDEVLRLLRLPVPQRLPAGAVEPLPMLESIRLHEVSFSYADDSAPALDRVSLTIPRGSRVALVGRSGSGKSTIADLMMGLIEPDSGEIVIDEIPLTGLTRRRWRQSIAHVPQSIFLADATLAQNIALAVPEGRLDARRLSLATAIAQLDEVIAGLPRGFDTHIGEGGARLSGGQRQRIGIARAIYKDAPVLVLDEATSSLDEATETAVLDALANAEPQRTIVMITHRRSAIEWCDRVFQLHAGMLVRAERMEIPPPQA